MLVHVVLERSTHPGERKWRSPEAAPKPELAGVSQLRAGFDRVELEPFLADCERSGEMLEGDGIGLVGDELDRAIRKRPGAAREPADESVAFVGDDVIVGICESFSKVGEHVLWRDWEIDRVGAKSHCGTHGETAERADERKDGCRSPCHGLASRRELTNQKGKATSKNAPRMLPIAAGAIPQESASPQPGPRPRGWSSEK